MTRMPVGRVFNQQCHGMSWCTSAYQVLQGLKEGMLRTVSFFLLQAQSSLSLFSTRKLEDLQTLKLNSWRRPGPPGMMSQPG